MLEKAVACMFRCQVFRRHILSSNFRIDDEEIGRRLHQELCPLARNLACDTGLFRVDESKIGAVYEHNNHWATGEGYSAATIAARG